MNLVVPSDIFKSERMKLYYIHQAMMYFRHFYFKETLSKDKTKVSQMIISAIKELVLSKDFIEGKMNSLSFE